MKKMTICNVCTIDLDTCCYHKPIGFEEILRVPIDEDDFSPFPSKMFAVMYLLIHSPRPMVKHMIFFEHNRSAVLFRVNPI